MRCRLLGGARIRLVFGLFCLDMLLGVMLDFLGRLGRLGRGVRVVVASAACALPIGSGARFAINFNFGKTM